MSKREIVFWGLFFLLNTLLFLPGFVLDINSSTFFPDFYHAGTPGEKWKFLFRRENQDIFRISVDLLILLWALVLFKNRKLPVLFRYVAIPAYLILFFYQVYQGSIQMLYQQKPLFYSDILLIQEGFSLLRAEMGGWILLILVILVVLVSILIYFALARFIKISRKINFSLPSKLILSLITVLCLMSLIDFRTRLDNLKLAFPWQGYWIFDNIRRSVIVRGSTHRLDPAAYNKHYNYDNCSMPVRPNIYLFFVESYGKVLYEDTDITQSYRANLQSNEAHLRSEGWQCTSAFSQSPVKGGRSWLAYTSFVTGTNINRHALFDYLMDNPEFNLPTLYKSLQSFGYRSYWLSALQNNGRDIPYEQYSRFYGIDHWIKFDDLNYQGKLYGALPAPADQYSLNFAHELIRQDTVDPFILFFISLNSHHPFDSPGGVADDWRLLSQTSDPKVRGSKNKVSGSGDQKDLHSINYQLDYLTAFIIENGRENDLFILIGDHQPPVLGNRSDSYDTPVHIISKDADLIGNFNKYNFNRGLVIKEKNGSSLKHAGFYSIIMREIIHAYGSTCSGSLNYFPDGLQLNTQ